MFRLFPAAVLPPRIPVPRNHHNQTHSLRDGSTRTRHPPPSRYPPGTTFGAGVTGGTSAPQLGHSSGGMSDASASFLQRPNGIRPPNPAVRIFILRRRRIDLQIEASRAIAPHFDERFPKAGSRSPRHHPRNNRSCASRISAHQSTSALISRGLTGPDVRPQHLSLNRCPDMMPQPGLPWGLHDPPLARLGQKTKASVDVRVRARQPISHHDHHPLPAEKQTANPPPTQTTLPTHTVVALAGLSGATSSDCGT